LHVGIEQFGHIACEAVFIIPSDDGSAGCGGFEGGFHEGEFLERHSWRRGVPHELHFLGSEAVGLIDEADEGESLLAG
jgi:hypothetical protein